jgi:hypothetical protein
VTNEIWALFCEIAFWGWVLTGAVFFLRSFPARDTFDSASAAAWGSVFLLCYAFWGFAMVNY